MGNAALDQRRATTLWRELDLAYDHAAQLRDGTDNQEIKEVAAAIARTLLEQSRMVAELADQADKVAAMQEP